MTKLSLVSTAALLAASSAFAAPMIGFSPAGAEAERATEAKFDAVLSADAIRDRMKLMSSEPNQVGSPHDKANAEYTLAQYKAWGWDAHIETFSVLYPTPKDEKLELGGAHPFKATLTEPALDGRCDLGPSTGRSAGLFRLWRRGRRHRAADLRQLRHAGGLRRTPEDGPRRQAERSSSPATARAGEA